MWLREILLGVSNKEFTKGIAVAEFRNRADGAASNERQPNQNKLLVELTQAWFQAEKTRKRLSAEALSKKQPADSVDESTAPSVEDPGRCNAFASLAKISIAKDEAHREACQESQDLNQ